MATAPEAAPAPAPVEEVTPSENFEAAFARLSLDEPAPAPAPAPAEPVATDPPTLEPDVTEPVVTDPVDTATLTDDTVKPTPAPAPAPTPAPVAPKDDETVLQRLADLVRQPAPQPEPQQQQPQQQRPVFSEEEASFLQQYEQDWPDVAKAEQLRRRAEYQQLVGYVFDQFQQHFQPVAAMVQQLATQTQLQQLQGAVPDYDVVREDVLNWVENQPTYLQVAYNHVINNGTVDEVSDLINRYKVDAGITSQAGAPAPTPTPTPQPKPRPATELPTATKQAAAALAPVSSKRTAVVTQTDPNDFESAFAAFSSAKSL